MTHSGLFRVTRPWALGLSVLLFTYAAAGGTAGVLWLIDLAGRLVAGPPPSKPFITAWSVNLLFVPVALAGARLFLRRGQCLRAARPRRPGAGVGRHEATPALGGHGVDRTGRVHRLHGRRRRADGRVSGLTPALGHVARGNVLWRPMQPRYIGRTSQFASEIDPTGATFVPGNAAIVCQFVEEVLNLGDIDGAARFMSEDVVQHVLFPGQKPGLMGFQEMMREARAAFPDHRWAVEEQLVDGDRVLTRFEWTGTHLGPFLGVAPTGRRVTVWGMVIDRVVDGRIKESRFLMDTMGLMAQLGAIPG
jgi:predicted ester cyclase